MSNENTKLQLFISNPTLHHKLSTIKLINLEKKVELNTKQHKLSSNVKMCFSIFQIQGFNIMFKSSERPVSSLT